MAKRTRIVPADPSRSSQPPGASEAPGPGAPAERGLALLETREALRSWIEQNLEVHIPQRPLLASSTAPMDYLVHTFFEGGAPPPAGGPSSPDCVVWANRGGGKTFLGAVATVLDMVFKPGIEVRILGGSLEQSERMYAHLRRMFERPALEPMVSRARGAVTGTSLRLVNGSAVEILAQSQRAVRGTRVQKLRCDEVDLFDPEVWIAAQLVTRSMRKQGVWGAWVRGSVEAFSTMHRPNGVMWGVVAESSMTERPAEAGGRLPRRLFRWGVVDALEPCAAERPCAGCGLEEECAGRAKGRSAGEAGHITVDDALALKGRVGRATWDAEMLCLRPRRDDAVLPEFDAGVHVFAPGGDETSGGADGAAGVLIAGIDFGFRAPTVTLWAKVSDDGVVRVLAERVLSGQTLDQHAQAIMESPLGRPAWIGADPAGHQRNDQTGASNIAQLRKLGLVVRARGSGLEEGLELLRQRLGPASGSPRLFVSSACARLIESLQRYHYPEDRPEASAPAKDGFDHAVDALRYMVLNLDRPHRTSCGRYVG